MQITPGHLIAAGIAPTQARAFAEPLTAACIRFGITSPVQVAALVAQCSHESAGFVKLEEDLYYRDPERVARLFRTAFDLDRDGKISQAEIEAARPYVRAPEKLASRVYANRYGNGDEASRDGWWYRARGLIGTTFKDNYAAAERALGRPYVAQPELMAQPADACFSAAYYFASRGCGPLASNIDAVTRKINPGMAGAADRRERFHEARRAFGC